METIKKEKVLIFFSFFLSDLRHIWRSYNYLTRIDSLFLSLYLYIGMDKTHKDRPIYKNQNRKGNGKKWRSNCEKREGFWAIWSQDCGGFLREKQVALCLTFPHLLFLFSFTKRNCGWIHEIIGKKKNIYF